MSDVRADATRTGRTVAMGTVRTTAAPGASRALRDTRSGSRRGYLTLAEATPTVRTSPQVDITLSLNLRVRVRGFVVGPHNMTYQQHGWPVSSMAARQVE